MPPSMIVLNTVVLFISVADIPWKKQFGEG